MYLILLISLGVGRTLGTGNFVPDNGHGQTSFYDYIIVGGGLTGLVVANRLTENSDSKLQSPMLFGGSTHLLTRFPETVLVIERGYLDDKPQAIIPYLGNTVDESVMMRPISAPVPKLNNSTFSVAVAGVVGGGTVVNGMAYSRGSAADYDAWEELGNPGWGWRGLLPYFRKSSTFVPPSPEAVRQWNMTWNSSVFDDGPVRTSISNFQYPDLAPFWDYWRGQSEIPQPSDTNDGTGPGLCWVPATIDPRLGARVTSRSAYYDPVYVKRPNLHLLTGHTVTEILFQDLHAKGVQAVSRSNNQTRAFYARKEVILAAGAIQTPQLLQVSGIGPRTVLEAAGIMVKKDFPAVGANFQDHPISIMQFNLSTPSFPTPDSIAQNATYNATVWEEYQTNHTGPYASARGTMIVWMSLSQLTSSTTAAAIAEQLRSIAQDPKKYLPSIYDHKALLHGYKAQLSILANRFVTNTSAVIALPYSASGQSPAALQKPLSRGTVTLNITNPHSLPVVQYNTLQNPIELQIILHMIRRNRQFWSTSIMAHLSPLEVAPGFQYQTDEELVDALVKRRGLLPSIAHPSGTCAMMPEKLGGVVGSDLKVYGVKGLRIVDASVMPLQVPGGLQGTLYAVAEKAADIIKGKG